MKVLSKLDLIRGAAKALAAARAKLSAAVGRLTAQVDAAHRRHLPIIRLHVGAVADTESNLRAAIKDAPDLFREPRSIVESGIKFGLQHHDETLSIPSARGKRDAIVEAMKRMFTEDQISKFDLIEYVEVPNADALLEQCSEKQIEQLVQLGAEYSPAGDRTLVKPADAAVDKLVAKLLKAASDAATDEAA